VRSAGRHPSGAGSGALVGLADCAEFDLDRRRCGVPPTAAWKPYTRHAPVETLLTTYTEFLKARRRRCDIRPASCSRSCRSSISTPAGMTRSGASCSHSDGAGDRRAPTMRFETAPASRVRSTGQAIVPLGGALVVRHVFVLTLGCCRRSFYSIYPAKRSPSSWRRTSVRSPTSRAHARASLRPTADRLRVECDGHFRWNATFKAFADFWGFDPRVCRPYRPRTKGKVESGVKYCDAMFYRAEASTTTRPGRQLAAWMAKVADVRVHGPRTGPIDASRPSSRRSCRP